METGRLNVNLKSKRGRLKTDEKIGEVLHISPEKRLLFI